MTTKAQVIWWGCAGFVLLLVLWLLGQAILPFIIGAGVAYLLDPLADRLERVGMSRTWAVVTITLCAVLVFVTFLLFLAPLVVRQTLQLVESVPAMTERLQEFLMARFPSMLAEGAPSKPG